MSQSGCGPGRGASSAHRRKSRACVIVGLRQKGRKKEGQECDARQSNPDAFLRRRRAGEEKPPHCKWNWWPNFPFVFRTNSALSPFTRLHLIPPATEQCYTAAAATAANCAIAFWDQHCDAWCKQPNDDKTMRRRKGLGRLTE